jgi:signal recognition particle receptor subunit beta
MGQLWSSPLQLAGFGPRPCCILMLGLDGAGKRTILHRIAAVPPCLSTMLSCGGGDRDHRHDHAEFTAQLYDWLCAPPIVPPVRSIQPFPSIGYTVTEITNQNLQLTVFDVGGQRIVRAVWRHYYRYADALIYVVDSSTSDGTERLTEAGSYLQELLVDLAALGHHRRAIPILVYANQQDLASPADIHTVAECLGLGQGRHHHGGPSVQHLFSWHVQPCSAKLEEGLVEGLDWLARELSSEA